MKISIVKYILRRLTEGSTLRNLVLFISSLSGLALSDQQTNSIVFIILGIIGFLGVTLPDNVYDLKRDALKDAPDIGYNDKSDLDETFPNHDYTDTNGVQSQPSPMPTPSKLGRTDRKDLEEFTNGFGDKR